VNVFNILILKTTGINYYVPLRTAERWSAVRLLVVLRHMSLIYDVFPWWPGGLHGQRYSKCCPFPTFRTLIALGVPHSDLRPQPRVGPVFKGSQAVRIPASVRCWPRGTRAFF